MIAIAGCAASESQEAGPSASDAPAALPEVSRSKGAIEGVVVDTSLFPVAGANVGFFPIASSTSMIDNVTTGEGGAFVFSLIEPGSYRVAASREGFGDAAVYVQVNPEEVAQVSLRLDEVESDEPYVETYPFTGLHGCGFAVVLWSDNCGAGPFSSTNARMYNISAGFKTILVETKWTESDVAMDNWVRWKFQSDTGWNFLGFKVGLPVLRMVMLPEQKPGGLILPNQPPKELPASDKDFVLWVLTFYDGKLQREINQTVPSEACKPLMGYCAGYGIAVDLRFNQWVSVFMNAAPPNVEKFSALPDG